MNLKVPIILFAIGVIVAFWPMAGLFSRVVSATLIITCAALPLVSKKRNLTLISILLVAIIVGFFYYFKGQSISSYLKRVDSLSIRYSDVEALSKSDGVDNWEPHFKYWEGNCLSGEYQFCRIASYIPRVKKEKRAEELLRIGCTNKDFLSCYNYFFYDEFSKDDRTFAKGIILDHCKKTGLTEEFKTICDKVALF